MLSSCPWRVAGPHLRYWCRGRQCWDAYLAEGRVQSQDNLPCWKKDVFVFLMMWDGNSPRIRVIIAKCSRLSWVWKRVCPWKINLLVIEKYFNYFRHRFRMTSLNAAKNVYWVIWNFLLAIKNCFKNRWIRDLILFSFLRCLEKKAGIKIL